VLSKLCYGGVITEIGAVLQPAATRRRWDAGFSWWLLVVAFCMTSGRHGTSMTEKAGSSSMRKKNEQRCEEERRKNGCSMEKWGSGRNPNCRAIAHVT